MLEREERDFTLQDFMSKVFDCFGVDYEEQSNGSWIARPSDNMHIEQFPGVPEGGVTLTFQRAQALEREELVFLTWDHPMIEDIMDMILDEALGQANATAISNSRFPKGIMLIEATYIYECIAERSLEQQRAPENRGAKTKAGRERTTGHYPLPAGSFRKNGQQSFERRHRGGTKFR